VTLQLSSRPAARFIEVRWDRDGESMGEEGRRGVDRAKKREGGIVASLD